MDLNNFNPDPLQPSSQQHSQGTKKSGLGALGPIGAGIDIFSGLMGALDSFFGWSAKRQQRYQKQLMDKQQSQWKEQQSILAQQQFDQWNRENEYNDPTNYFKRLMAGADANGLSKAAVLGDMPGGSVGQSATGVSAPGSTSAPGVGGSTLLPFGSTNVLGAMRQRAEIANIEANTSKTEKEGGLVSAQTTTEMLKQSYQESLNKIQAIGVQTAGIVRDLTGVQLQMAKFDRSVQSEKFNLFKRETESKIENNFSQAYKAVQDGNFSISRKAEVYANIRLMESQTALNFAYRALQIQLARGAKLNSDLLEQNYGHLSRQIMNQALIGSRQYEILGIEQTMKGFESEIKRKENKWYNWNQGVNSFSSIVSTFTDALTATAGAVNPLSTFMLNSF